MCLVAIAWRAHATLPLVVVANRDEMHARPTAPMAWWPAPALLAGRDLEAGGTWFAVDHRGRFGVVTNVRGQSAPPDAPSRGSLLPRFVAGDAAPLDFLAEVAAEAGRYAGFNLLVGDPHGLACLSNADRRGARALDPGIHAISNGPPDTRWPKVRHASERLAVTLAGGMDDAALLAVLDERRPAPDPELPDTGIGLELERALSAPFIVQPRYGTRSTTVLAVGPAGGRVLERSYDPSGQPLGLRRFQLPAPR